MSEPNNPTGLAGRFVYLAHDFATFEGTDFKRGERVRIFKCLLGSLFPFCVIAADGRRARLSRSNFTLSHPDKWNRQRAARAEKDPQ